MSALLDNAIDSLKVGVDFFVNRPDKSAHKHAILLIFHAIELLIKEHLSRVHPILIYKNIDQPINEDSMTVGFDQMLIRLKNLNVQLEPDQAAVLRNLQRRRNCIEHHVYDRDDNDASIVGQSIRFIAAFLHGFLGTTLGEQLDADQFAKVTKLICDYEELKSIADSQLDKWITATYPTNDTAELGSPESFPGTVDCPICREELLVMEDHPEAPYCFFCRSHVDAAECEHCGIIYLPAQGSHCNANA